jgi:vacuolar-type H+-ATPase catalytic subunit A/Vma1
MSQRYKQDLLARISEVLHYVWDPIGICGEALRAPTDGSFGCAPPVTQQKFTRAFASAQLIALGCQTRTYRIAQCLMRRIPHPHSRQVPSPVAASQLLASRRSVLTRSAAFTGISVGATTSHFTPNSLSYQYNTYPVGPAP